MEIKVIPGCICLWEVPMHTCKHAQLLPVSECQSFKGVLQVTSLVWGFNSS